MEDELSQLVKHFKSEKTKIVGVIVAILIITASISAYFLWPEGEEVVTEDLNKIVPTAIPADDAMSNWQTYRNEEYGFEVKYPFEWVADRTNNDKRISFYSANKADVQNDFQFTIAIIDSEQWRNTSETMKDYILNKPESSEVMIANRQATKSETKTQDDMGIIVSGSIQYIFIEDGTFFSFVTNYNKESSNIGEKIISTFKFIEQ
ncbi:hypothetical protein ACFLY5_00890 [Patescibacteria group bacterium]